MIAGGLLLVSGIAASAKPDSANAEQGQKGQQQTQQDRKPAVAPAATSTTQPTMKPATKPATAASPTICTAQAEQAGEFEGEHQDAGCNGQQNQSGVNESTTETNDQSAANGNHED